MREILLDKYFSNYHFLLSPFFSHMYHWVIYYKWPSSSSFFSLFSFLFLWFFLLFSIIFLENDRFARRGWADGYISHGPSTRFVHDFPPPPPFLSSKIFNKLSHLPHLSHLALFVIFFKVITWYRSRRLRLLLSFRFLLEISSLASPAALSSASRFRSASAISSQVEPRHPKHFTLFFSDFRQLQINIEAMIHHHGQESLLRKGLQAVQSSLLQL